MVKQLFYKASMINIIKNYLANNTKCGRIQY